MGVLISAGCDGVAEWTLIAVGLAAVVTASASAYAMVKVAGGSYVIWLGIQAIRHRRDARAAPGVARDWFARKPARLDTLGTTGGVMMVGLGATTLATE